jgi:DNA-binding response OmpR family regulator
LDALRAAPGKYVAVIIDVMMPGKSGLEVLAELRKDSDLPAMLVTGVEMDGAELSAQQEVNTSCLYKPFSSDAFLATLGALRQRAVGIT